ncbi:uncharacterized protein LOC111119657 [Crassostrea virginica]
MVVYSSILLESSTKACQDKKLEAVHEVAVLSALNALSEHLRCDHSNSLNDKKLSFSKEAPPPEHYESSRPHRPCNHDSMQGGADKEIFQCLAWNSSKAEVCHRGYSYQRGQGGRAGIKVPLVTPIPLHHRHHQ